MVSNWRIREQVRGAGAITIQHAVNVDDLLTRSVWLRVTTT